MTTHRSFACLSTALTLFALALGSCVRSERPLVSGQQTKPDPDGRTLKYWLFENDFLAKAIAEGKSKGTVQQDGSDLKSADVTLRATSDDLLRFVESANPAELYGDPVVLTRVQ